MAGTQEVIREYLVKLGFVIDKKTQEDFGKTVVTTDKMIGSLSKGLLLAAAAVVAMATKFALSMDSLYYSSQKASSSAANLKAFEYAGRQIGMTGEAITSMVTNLTMTLRTDPGMRGWLESLGVNADEARQGTDIWLDFLTKVRDMPPYQGIQFAQMIGMSPDQFFQIETNLDQFRAKIQARKGMASAMDLDQDAAAVRGRDLANAAGTIAERGSIALDKAGESAAPTLSTAADKLNQAGDILLRGVRGQITKEEIQQNQEHPWWARENPNKEQSKSLIGSQPAWMDRLNEKWFGKNQTKSGTQAEAMFGSLEAAFGLPKGEMDHIWKNESNRGDPRFMRSSAGAEGHFGLMPATAKELGVTDPNDLSQSASGAATMLGRLKKKYGSMEDAERAYNWGEGNYDRYLGAKAQGKNPKLPKETANYTQGSPITVNVNGNRDPVATADAVVMKLHRWMGVTAADEQRYLPGNTR